MESSATNPSVAVPAWAQETYGLITAGKCKQAVEAAKAHHKQRNNEESERVLVDAYLSRIEQFQAKGAGEDARTLIQIVGDRFPRHRDRLISLSVSAAAVSGQIGELLAPLAIESTPEATRLAIEAALRQHIVDLSAVAACGALPQTHPIRVAAGEIWQAFTAVTSGAVTDEQIALSAVSRRGPLAAWKLLIRAIAAFYREDDAGCRQALAAIPADSAAARLVPALLALLDKKPVSGAIGALQSRVGAGDTALETLLTDCDRAFQGDDLTRLRKMVRQVLQQCERSHPELLKRLRQQLLARCVLEGAPIDDLAAFFDGFLRTAESARIMAWAMGKRDELGPAATLWQAFLNRAIAEGLFQADSPEVAVVYAHMATELAQLTPGELKSLHRSMPDIAVEVVHGRDAGESSPDQLRNTTLNPDWLFRQACRIHPDSGVFARWWHWAQERNLHFRAKQEIAELWQRRIPTAIEPALHLVELAESRKAYTTALVHLEAAEKLNPLHPKVRLARIVLIVATFWRHAKERKVHLMQQDLMALECLPAMREGERGTLLLALQYAAAIWDKNAGEAEACRRQVLDRAGVLAGSLVLHIVGHSANLKDLEPVPTASKDHSGQDLALALVRATRLAQEVGIAMVRPKSWLEPISSLLKQRPCPLTPPDILTLGNLALRAKDRQQAYLASAAGLEQASGSMTAKMLLLRAGSFERWHAARIAQCVVAARALAQQAHDPELLDEIAAAASTCDEASDAISATSGNIDDKLLSNILAAERKATDYPRGGFDPDKSVVFLPHRFGPPALPRDYGDYEEEDDEDDELWDEDDENPADGDISLSSILSDSNPPPREAIPILSALVAKYGRIPDMEELCDREPEAATKLLRILAKAGTLPPKMAPLAEHLASLMEIEHKTTGASRRKSGKPKRRKR